MIRFFQRACLVAQLLWGAAKYYLGSLLGGRPRSKP
jgi:hypothetical protein